MKQARRFTLQQGWKILITDMGVPYSEVLKLAGLPGDLFARKEMTLSVEEYFQLWRGLELAVGDEELPLSVGRHLSMEAFEPAIFACMCSPNLNVALQRLSHYKRLVGPLFLDVKVEEAQTRVDIGIYQTTTQLPKTVGLCELVFLTRLARLGTRHRVVPLKLVCNGEVARMDPYRTYFENTVQTGSANQIVFSAQDANRPFLTENAGMWSFFEADLKKRLSDLDETATTVQRVKSALLEMLPSGQNSIDHAASRLAMSKRTLQRHLNREGANFQFVLNKTREELAKHYLSNSTIPIGEISYLLGFQDTNSFVRAYKGWTGSTPGKLRA